MVKVNAGEHCFYLDGILKDILDSQKKYLKRDYDLFLLIDGREGYGKSTFASQIATYLDPTYNLDRCCFTIEQFEKAVVTAKPHEAIVFDETMGYLASRSALSKFNKRLVKIFSEMRSRNLIIILCITNFFEMDRYAAIHRAEILFNIPKRAMFKAYCYHKKKKMYINGKKYYTYTESPDFYGPFVKYFPLDKESYEKKKQKAIAAFTKDTNREKHLMEQKRKLVEWVYKNEGLSQEKIGEIIDESQQGISYLLENPPTEQDGEENNINSVNLDTSESNLPNLGD